MEPEKDLGEKSFITAPLFTEGSEKSGTCGANLFWALENGVLTISGTGSMDDYDMNAAPWSEWKDEIISIKIEEGVQRIGKCAFKEFANLTKVMFLSTDLTDIGEGAFQSCISLPSIVLPESLTVIRSNTFWHCSDLERISIPKRIQAIGNRAFSNCERLSEVSFEPVSELKTIGDSTFDYCGALRDIVIPENVMEIGEYAFFHCSALQRGVLPSEMDTVGTFAFGYCQELSEITLPQTINISFGSNIFLGCEKLEAVSLPSGITSIKSNTFARCTNLKRVDIPDTVNEIQREAFISCMSLQEVNGLENVGTIGGNAFSGCKSLSAIQLSNTLTKLEVGAFQYCSNLERVTIPGTVRQVEGNAFSGCSGLREVELQSGIRKIGQNAFRACRSLTKITLPDTLESLEIEAFQDCTRLSGVKMSEFSSLNKLEDAVFENCTSLEEFYFPSGVTSIPTNTFRGCVNLVTVGCSGSMESIGKSAFERCEKLCNISVANINSIEASAFRGCKSLVNIDFSDTITSISDETFYGCSSLVNIKLPDAVTSIGSNSFSGCSSLVNVEIPDTVTSIGSGAFSGCSSLERVVVPSSLSKIETSVFSGCKNLKEVQLPENLLEISAFAFASCAQLEEIRIPDSVTLLGKNAFDGCRGLQIVVLSENLNIIPKRAFYNCNELQSVVLPENIKFIGEEAFYSCSSLANISIPAGIQLIATAAFQRSGVKRVVFLDECKEIQEEAFCECKSLEYVDLKNVGGKIPRRAFYNCDNLKKVVVGVNIESIGEYAFSSCSSLSDIQWPSALKTLEAYCFERCVSLQKIELVGVESIGRCAFESCVNLQEVVLPDTVLEIEAGAFQGCRGLKTVILSQSLERIGVEAFSNCINLEYVPFPSSLKTIEERAFYNCKMTANFVPSSVGSIGDQALGIKAGVTDGKHTILGYYGTVAETYANENDMIFIEPTSFTIPEEDIVMEVGGKKQLTYILNGVANSGTREYIIWKSSEPDIVRVMGSELHASGEGEAFITAELGDQSFSYHVTVTPVKIKDFYIYNKSQMDGENLGRSIKMEVGKTEQWGIKVVPSDVKEPWSAEWFSSDPNIISVDNGTVTVKRAGNVTISVQVGTKTRSIEVNAFMPLQSVFLPERIEVTAENTHRLMVQYSPSDATIEHIYWYVSDTSIAYIPTWRANEVEFYCFKPGTFTLYAKVNGRTVSCIVTVVPPKYPLKNIYMLQEALVVRDGSSNKIDVCYEPWNTTDLIQPIWSTSNSSVAEVKNGVIFARHAGTAVITAKVGKKTANCTVTVKPKWEWGLSEFYGNSAWGFVARLYEMILERSPDDKGLNDWALLLKSGQATGAEVAYGFITSREFTSRNISDAEFVELLYQTFMCRYSDSGGKQTWIRLLENGVSRVSVFKGFAESVEFNKVCRQYGIMQGTVDLTEPRDQNAQVTMYVDRLYRVCLGRKADIDGLNDWTRFLLERQADPKEVAKGFIFSRELQGKHLSPEAYVELHYQAFMGRKSDPSGKATWVRLLKEGMSRDELFWGFANSQEFDRIISSYGL